MTVDWLVVGAGFSGCTIAERLAEDRGDSVLLIDRRNHIGGNAYDACDEHGILVHRYGPHIFHTNSEAVRDYLTRFTDWRPYEHRVLAVLDGRKVTMPFNLDSLYEVFGRAEAERLERALVAEYGANAKVPILRMRESASADIRRVAGFVYDKIFLGYTLKQWGIPPDQLDPLVTGRVPARLNRDNRYFEDSFQKMPREGFTVMFRRMLASGRIQIRLNADYETVARDTGFRRVVYTGPIDEFFGFRHGRLPYRSLRFEFLHLEQEYFQEVGTVNYPGGEAFTRITEQKYLSGQTAPSTTLVREYAEPYEAGRNEPYYPIPQTQNRELYNRYVAEIPSLSRPVWFLGRLADYKYYNMDQAVARALKLYQSELRRAE